MPGNGPKFYNCLVCNKRTKPKERRSVNSQIKKYLRKKLFIDAKEKDIICNKCRHQYYLSETVPIERETDKKNDPDYLAPTVSSVCTVLPSSPPSVQLAIKGTTRTHACCLVCKRPGPKLIVLSFAARLNAFIEENILIPTGARFCPVHTTDGFLDKGVLNAASVLDQSYLNRSSIVKLIEAMRTIISERKSSLDFDNINPIDCQNLTGLSKADFDDVLRHVEDKIRNSPVRSVRTTIGIFFLKMKSGLSNKIISTVFGISKSSVRRAITTVRQALMRGFVPLYLGINSVTREDIINNHTRPIAKTLLNATDNQMILVLDGTYIYIQKSNNFSFQRRSYSMHKGRPLVKPMVVVTTTGYFISIMGPYLADYKNNDAAILNHMLLTNTEEIKDFLHADDILVVDRGFRDSLSMLEDLGIRAEMPAFLVKGQKQMTCEDANRSRFVTKIRWVVESANARIKSWKYLTNVLPTNQIPYVGDYVRIACAISNKYQPPLSSPAKRDEDAKIAERMYTMAANINSLKVFVEENYLDKKNKSLWIDIDTLEADCFPKLSENQLRTLTCGVYQLRMSTSYIQEHMAGNCVVQILRESKDIIRVSIQSRHISSKKYLMWLKFSPTDVLAWYCKCRAGARVVGMCSHIAAVVWYLSYARHIQCDKYGVRDWGESLQDAAHIPAIIDESDSDTDASVFEE